MGTATLFGDESDVLKPRTPPPAEVVRELVALGVSEATAAGYENRQAFAVLKRLRAAAADPARAGEPAPEPAPAPPPRPDRGGTQPERRANAADLEYMLEHEMADPYERLCNRLVCSLYPLTRVEFRRVVSLVIRELRSEG